MKENELIQAVDVVRDEHGYWCHPGVPDSGGADLRPWLEQQQLEVRLSSLESEEVDHPAYVEYFEKEGASVTTWEPAAPPGPGWFTLAIYDTEDGPQWLWARHKREEPSEAHA